MITQETSWRTNSLHQLEDENSPAYQVHMARTEDVKIQALVYKG